MRKVSRASRSSLKRIASGGVVLALVALFGLPTAAFAAGPTNVSVTGNTVTALASGDQVNVITLGNSGATGSGGISIKDTGPSGAGVTLTPHADCIQFSPDEVRCDLGTITAVVVNMLDRNDTVNILNNSLGSITVNAGDGNDTLNGGPVADILNGDDGDDTLKGGNGNDTLNGGPNTALTSTGDWVDYGAATSAVLVTIDGVADDGRNCPGLNCEADNVGTTVENVEGSNFADTITGSASANVLRGGPGADTLNGAAGDDTLRGEGGGDDLNGGTGGEILGDTVSYSTESSTVTVTIDNVADDGPAGENDNVHTDVEIVVGGTGPDNLTGGAGNETLRGGSGNDTLNGSLGNDTLAGGAGSDTVSYETRAVPVTITLDGLANDGAAGETDNVQADIENAKGGTAADSITGNAGVNRLDGFGGADQLFGLGGNDVLVGWVDGDADTYNGGGGTDTVTFANASAVAGVNVAADGSASVTDGEIIETSVENLTGHTGNDTLLGNGSRNRLNGGAGNDTLLGDPVCPPTAQCPSNDTLNGALGQDLLRGRDGADVMNGGPGGAGLIDADTIDGGLGTDSVSYSTRSGDVRLTLDGVANDGAIDSDAVTAGNQTEGDDIQADTEKLTGGKGDDIISGDASRDTLTGGAGNDNVDGNGGNDTINGNAGNDTLTGGGGRDILSGSTGNDTFITNDGLRDSINCGDGNDNIAAPDPVDTKTANCVP